MSKPTPQEYQEAIQHPTICFKDYELQRGMPVKDILQLPYPISGNFASVFQIICGEKKYAARCFLRDVPDIEERYRIISEYLDQVKLPYFVDFRFIEEGILVKGKWFPLTKLEWVNGDTLDIFIDKNLHNPEKIWDIAQKFYQLVSDLKRCSISHGDLHPGNILVENGNLRLIDYDAMYVPKLVGYKSNEIGHKNFQHPLRDFKDYGPYIDNFSEWIIYLSLLLVSGTPELWNKLECGDDCLLFRQSDIENPENSEIFLLLENNTPDDIQNLISSFKYNIYSTNLSQISSIIDISLPVEMRIGKGVVSIEEQSIDAPIQDDSAWIWELKPVVYHFFDPPILFERIIGMSYFSLMLMTALSYLTNVGDEYLMIWAPVYGSLILILMLNIKYRLINVVQEKRILLAEQNKFQKNKRRIIKKRKKIEKNLENVIKKENKEIEYIRSKKKKNNKKEQNEILIEKRKLNEKIRYIMNRITSINSAKQKELSDTLDRLQKTYFNDKLKKHKVRNASIKGIGPTLTKRLNSAGIYTAADFIDISIYYYNTPNGEAYLQLPNKRHTRVYGIGPQKASGLKMWRDRLFNRYRSGMPRKLEFGIVNVINAKYSSELNLLNENKRKEEENTSDIVSNINRKYVALDKELNNDLQIIREKYLDQKNELTSNVKKQDEDIQDVNWSINQKKYELKSYNYVTLKNYLKKIFLFKQVKINFT